MSEKNYADLISKLLLKAESTDSPEEAETFFAKAQELMTQYAIDEAMITAARKLGDKADDKITQQEFVTVGIYRYPLSQLAYYVLLVNDIECIKLSEPGWREIDGKVFKETEVLVGVGYESDLRRARTLETSLKLQAMRAENAWWDRYQELYRGEKRGGHYQRRQFLQSFGAGVYEKLEAAANRGRDAAAEEHGVNSVALVIRDKSLAVRDEYERRFPNRRQTRRRLKGGDAWAHQHGYAAGQKADLGGPKVGGGKKQITR